MRLYHYTCEHSVSSIIAERGLLRPNPHEGPSKLIEGAYTFGVIWLTDIDARTIDDVRALGLTGVSGLTQCNRTGWRFVVPRVGVVPWSEYADSISVDPEYRAALEAEGCAPTRWWVARKPISGARLDERYPGILVVHRQR